MNAVRFINLFGINHFNSLPANATCIQGGMMIVKDNFLED